jgi:uncharacterized protein
MATDKGHQGGMKISDVDILVVPGRGITGPDHWQARWVEKMVNARMIWQKDWDNPEKDVWVEVLFHDILMATRPVVLVGHSLGATTIVHTAERLVDTKVRGAFLVAPPDVEVESPLPSQTAGFAPLPRGPLPFPSLLIASGNDPYATTDRASEFAAWLVSDFHLAGEAGHIDAESGHGPWPEGLMMFARLMKRLK